MPPVIILSVCEETSTLSIVPTLVITDSQLNGFLPVASTLSLGLQVDRLPMAGAYIVSDSSASFLPVTWSALPKKSPAEATCRTTNILASNMPICVNHCADNT